MINGKSIRLFLADGTPGGLLTAEIMNWTGHVLAAPRSDLPALLNRPEASSTGIYILLGDDPDSLGGELGYIGEADEVGKRLRKHARPGSSGGKDFWERAIVLTSKDSNLTKAHVRFLESRFIALAKQANRLSLTNSTAPPLPPLPEADHSDMEFFVSQAQIVLPVLGVNIFRTTKSLPNFPPLVTTSETEQNSVDFVLTYPKVGVQARARIVDGEFTVAAGSHARPGWPVIKAHLGYSALKSKLEADGTLEVDPVTGNLVFVHDQVFASPSAAAAVIYGRAANGRVKWRVEHTGQTFGDWQAQGVDLSTYEDDDSDGSYEIDEDDEFE